MRGGSQDALSIGTGQRVHRALANVQQVAVYKGATQTKQPKRPNAVCVLLVNQVKIGYLQPHVRGRGE